MQISIIGGTVFLGRALVEAAQTQGHTLTLFNRGRSNPGLFPEVETITGDRSADLHLLEGRAWDAVIDTCGYLPEVVRQSAQALHGRVGSYTFISSCSVYADVSQPDISEDAPVARLAQDADPTDIHTNYGPLKALCDEAVLDIYGDQGLVIRPGLIVGPHDPSDRFTYWPHRLDLGGEVLAPGRPDRPIQYIDVRDLAEWILRLIEAGQSGIYNAITPPGQVTMSQVLGACHLAAGKPAQFTWVDDDFLLSQGIEPWMEMPLWIPETDASMRGFFSFESQKAQSAGLTYRPLQDTVQATLTWDRTRPSHPWRAGLSSEKEAQVLTNHHLSPTPTK